MGPIETVTQRAYAYAWSLLDKGHTFTIRYPKPGAEPFNVLYGPTDDSGYETVTYAGCVAGWFRDVLTEDGYRLRDKKTGRAILLRDSFYSTDGDGNPVPLTVEQVRTQVGKPSVECAFDGQAVTVTAVTDDPRCNSVVIDFREVD